MFIDMNNSHDCLMSVWSLRFHDYNYNNSCDCSEDENSHFKEIDIMTSCALLISSPIFSHELVGIKTTVVFVMCHPYTADGMIAGTPLVVTCCGPTITVCM